MTNERYNYYTDTTFSSSDEYRREMRASRMYGDLSYDRPIAHELDVDSLKEDLLDQLRKKAEPVVEEVKEEVVKKLFFDPENLVL